MSWTTGRDSSVIGIQSMVLSSSPESAPPITGKTRGRRERTATSDLESVDADLLPLLSRHGPICSTLMPCAP